MYNWTSKDIEELGKLEGRAQEAKIRELLDNCFNSIKNDKQRLELQQMQFRIEAQLHKYKDPVARMNKFIEIFWKELKENAQKTHNACVDIATLLGGNEIDNSDNSNDNNDTVIQFKKPSN